MGNFDDMSQKIKGKVQQAKGTVEQSTGQDARGLWTKTKGKINEKVADMKINKDLNIFNHE